MEYAQQSARNWVNGGRTYRERGRERKRESGSEKEEKERVTTHAEVTQVAEFES